VQNPPLSNHLPIAPGSPVYIRRHALHDLLKQSLQSPLITVVAGAGYGKTQTIYSFLQEIGAVKIWLQLSEQDNLSWRFWEKFAQAFSDHNPALAALFKELDFPQTERQFERYVSLSGKAMLPDTRYVFVFDDFHLITDESVLKFVEKQLTAFFPKASAILISRTEPGINLISLLAKEMVVQINENDLCFREDEMSEYFSLLTITLPPQTVSDIYLYTGGWAFAISLVGLWLKNGSVQADYILVAMKLNISKLIETEIFSDMSEGLQKFLVKLSLIDHLSMDLLRDLAPDPTLIGEMEKISAFIRYDANTNMYWIHHLFLEYLKQKQNLLSARERRETYEKAAQWLADNQNPLDAITYYEKAENYKGIAKNAYIIARMIPDRVSRFLLDLLDRIPEEAYRENAEFYIIKSKALQSLARFDEASRHTYDTIKRFETLPPSKLNHWVLSECYLNLGYIGIWTALHTNIRQLTYYFEQAHQHHLMSARLVKGPIEHASVSSYVNRVSYPVEKGYFKWSIDIFSEYIHYMSKIKNGLMHGMIDLAYAEMAYFKGDVKNAGKLAYQAIGKARSKEQFQIENRALFFLLRINLHTGNLTIIQEVFRQLDAQLTNKEFLGGYTMYDIITGWFFAHIGQTDKLSGWLKSDFEKSDLNSLLYGLEELVRAKYYLTEKKYAAILDSFENSDAKFGLEAFLLGKLEVLVLKAVCRFRLKNPGEAFAALQEAYTVSQTEDFNMPFIEMGKDMRDLLDAAVKDPLCTLPAPWMEKIRESASTYAKKVSVIAREYQYASGGQPEISPKLTARETEILSDLACGLTRKEIAKTRYLSENTVKSDIKHIYHKLNAANRAEAVRVATALNLV
jgi:LuxR family maltose regulon positive regulatory protein